MLLLLFLLSLDLLRSQALALGCFRGQLFHVEVERVFVQGDLKFVLVENFLVGCGVSSVLVERHVVAASPHAQRKILALLVGLERVFLTVVLVGVDHHSVDYRIAFGVFANALHRSRGGLCENRGST